jgi:hypothetical protein
MIVGRFRKAPGDKLDYTLLYEQWLDGDTIDTSSFTIPPGLSSAGTATNTTTTTTVWIQGGTSGKTYTVSNTIVTTNATPRTKVVTFELEILP